MRVAIEAVLTGQVLAAWLLLEDLHHEEHPDFRDAVTTTCARMSKRWEGLAPASIPVLAPARELYNALGMEPTRHRPSSEALLRRVLQGKGLYRLDPIVDCGNLFSLAHSLPLGLYDREHIEESITLRLGFEGESYPGIRKDLVNVGGRLCLADALGAFGSPTSDSHRCRIRPRTSRVFTLLYAPPSYTAAKLAAAAELLGEAFTRWNGARVGAHGMLGI